MEANGLNREYVNIGSGNSRNQALRIAATAYGFWLASGKGSFEGWAEKSQKNRENIVFV